MLTGDSYHYTLNGVEHKIPCQKIEIKGQLLQTLNERNRERELLSIKFFLKYLHDLFEVHNIDYAIYGHTLLGYDLFQGVHIFHPTVEIVMVYRNMEEFYKEIQSDGFHIDFASPFVMVLSGSFFHKKMIKAYIYFLHPDPSDGKGFIHLSPAYLFQCKALKEIGDLNPENAKEYQIQTVHFYQLFPYKQVAYEDFHLFIPNQSNSILITLSLHQSKYLFDQKEKGSKRSTQESSNSGSGSIFDSLITFPKLF